MSERTDNAASTLRRYIETAYPSDTDEAHQALDALLEENERLREELQQARRKEAFFISRSAK